MNNQITEQLREKSISKLKELFNTYGVDERSLGWTKNKQNLRFAQIASRFDINSASVLDVGCGFADLLTFLKDNFDANEFKYTGIDIMSDFIEVASKKHPEAEFYTSDLFNFSSDRKYKYVVACGCLTYLNPNNEDDAYELIEAFISKMLNLCEDDGVVAIHFLSDKVDYHSSADDFHTSPERILSLAYKFSRRVVLDNSVFPFETCLFIYKDDSFKKETTVFNGI